MNKDQMRDALLSAKETLNACACTFQENGFCPSESGRKMLHKTSQLIEQALASEPTQQANHQSWYLNGETSKFLADTILANDEPEPIVLSVGFVKDDDGAVSHGLRMQFAEYPEEGAIMLVESEPQPDLTTGANHRSSEPAQPAHANETPKSMHENGDVYREPAQQYDAENPLGGPAKVFDAMAAAVRAGESFDDVLTQFGFARVTAQTAQAQPEAEKTIPPVVCEGEETKRAVEKILAQPAQEPVASVLAEVTKATAKFPTWPTDPLHAVAVLGEEFGELTKAVLQHVYEPHKSTADDVRTEAIQTAAMSMRFLMSLEQYEYAKCEQHKQGEHHGAN